MEIVRTVLLLLMAAIAIFVGIKTIITRETKVLIQLWSWGGSGINRGGGGYSESTQTGFVAVLVGIAEIGAGVSLLASAFS